MTSQVANNAVIGNLLGKKIYLEITDEGPAINGQLANSSQIYTGAGGESLIMDGSNFLVIDSDLSGGVLVITPGGQQGNRNMYRRSTLVICPQTFANNLVFDYQPGDIYVEGSTVPSNAYTIPAGTAASFAFGINFYDIDTCYVSSSTSGVVSVPGCDPDHNLIIRGTAPVDPGTENTYYGCGAGPSDANGGNQNVYVGRLAGNANPVNFSCVGVGHQAGQTGQNNGATAVGHMAGNDNQGSAAVAVGSRAGQIGQGQAGVAIGQQSGYDSQGANAVAIGQGTGNLNQGADAIAIGRSAGFQNQGDEAIAIGYQAGNISQPANSVVINGTGAPLNATGPNQCHLAPIRADPGSGDPVMVYDAATGEVKYDTAAIAGAPTAEFGVAFVPDGGYAVPSLTNYVEFASLSADTVGITIGGAGSDEITVSSAGRYAYHVCFTGTGIAGGIAFWRLETYKSGVLVTPVQRAYSDKIDNTGNQCRVNMSGVADLEAGDYIKVIMQGFVGSGTLTIDDQEYGFVTIYKVA